MYTTKIWSVDRADAIKWCKETFGSSSIPGFGNTFTTNWCVFGETFGFSTEEQLSKFKDKWDGAAEDLYNYVIECAKDFADCGYVYIPEFFSIADEQTCKKVIDYIESIPGSKIDIVENNRVVFNWVIPENI